MQLIFWDCRLLSWATTATAMTGIALCKIGLEYPFARLLTDMCKCLVQQKSNQVERAVILLAEMKQENQRLKLKYKQLSLEQKRLRQ